MENKNVSRSAEVLEILRKQLNKKPEQLEINKRIKEDLGADSLDIVEVLMSVEERYGVMLPDEELMKVSTVGETRSIMVSTHELGQYNFG